MFNLNIHKTIGYHLYTYNLIPKSCSTGLLFLFYSSQSFLFSAFHITFTPSSPLVFCASSSSVLISSLVLFISSSLVLVSSAVTFPSCFSSQPTASCGSSRDTMYLCASSACFFISMTSFCRESIMPSRSV